MAALYRKLVVILATVSTTRIDVIVKTICITALQYVRDSASLTSVRTTVLRGLDRIQTGNQTVTPGLTPNCLGGCGITW